MTGDKINEIFVGVCTVIASCATTYALIYSIQSIT